MLPNALKGVDECDNELSVSGRLGESQCRILHVLASLDQRYGGPLRAVLDLCAAGESLGVTSEVLGFGPLNVPDNPFPPERIHHLPSTGRYCHSAELRPWLRKHL